MSSIAAVEGAREARFRHIVFRQERSAAPINFAPLPPPPPLPPSNPLKRWGLHSNDPHYAPRPIAADELNFVRWLFARADLDARIYRTETLARRLPACLRAVRARSLSQARQRLEDEPGLTATALGAMLIGVSEFFRDAPVFEQLWREVLPTLPRRAGHPRVWSIGCSDGQELYSVAMMLSELKMLAGATLLGTDCRSAAVARAREGRYDESALRGVPPSLVSKYCVDEPSRGMWRVCDEVRMATQWRSGDATRRSERGAWDLILCRNVSMYLQSEVASQLRRMCEQSLRVGGVLVFGRAERPQGMTRLTLLGPCVYRKE